MATNVGRIYLDYNATTPVAAEVLEIITETLKSSWCNPSSIYDEDIIFTSGGTEGNNLVIYSAIQYFHDNFSVHCENNFKRRKFLPHIITTNIEHDSITLPLKNLSKKGIIEVTFVPVSTNTASVEVEDVLKEIQPNTCLITVMLANNETGIIQPVSQLGKTLQQLNSQRNFPILFHTDAAQAIGKIAVDVNHLHIDFLTIAGHKFYGPRIGAIYFNSDKSNVIYPLFYGGGQERGYRPGTENTAMIAGLGKASELIIKNLDIYQRNMRESRDYLEKKLKEVFGELVHFNNLRDIERLPNTCSVAFTNHNIKGQHILEKVNVVQASVGAACHGSNGNPSVLVASGISKELAESTLRLTTGRDTTEEDINTIILDLKETIRSIYNL